jgi:hypothetical protein
VVFEDAGLGAVCEIPEPDGLIPAAGGKQALTVNRDGAPGRDPRPGGFP